MGPFDVTFDDIQRLNDDQLRNVLRLLLEAEAKQHSIPLSAIRLGGDQNAADGGVDARVEWEGGPEHTEWFPKRLTNFQSKAEEMPKSKLKSELAPGGTPRLFFDELARESAAYIVFSTNNCSEGMYKDRLAGMRDAVANVPLADQITLDFYDASRIARWVNCFHGVANYVRNTVGLPMAGWDMKDPRQRAVRAARLVKYFYSQEDNSGKVLWSPIAEKLIDLPDVGIDVLNVFYSRFHVGVSSGPWSNRFILRRPLLEDLTSHDDPSIRAWADDTLGKLDQHIARLTNEERTEDERFE